VSLARLASLQLEVLGQAAFQRTPHGQGEADQKIRDGPHKVTEERMIYCGNWAALLLGISFGGARWWGILAPLCILASCEAQVTIKVHQI